MAVSSIIVSVALFARTLFQWRNIQCAHGYEIKSRSAVREKAAGIHDIFYSGIYRKLEQACHCGTGLVRIAGVKRCKIA